MADELACKPGCLRSDWLTRHFPRITGPTCGNTLTASDRRLPGMSGFSRTFGGLLKLSRTCRGLAGPPSRQLISYRPPVRGAAKYRLSPTSRTFARIIELVCRFRIRDLAFLLADLNRRYLLLRRPGGTWSSSSPLEPMLLRASLTGMRVRVFAGLSLTLLVAACSGAASSPSVTRPVTFTPVPRPALPLALALGPGPCRGTTARLLINRAATPVTGDVQLHAQVGDVVRVVSRSGCPHIFQLANKAAGAPLRRQDHGWLLTRPGRVSVPINYAMCDNARPKKNVPCVGGLATLATARLNVAPPP